MMNDDEGVNAQEATTEVLPGSAANSPNLNTKKAGVGEIVVGDQNNATAVIDDPLETKDGVIAYTPEKLFEKVFFVLEEFQNQFSGQLIQEQTNIFHTFTYLYLKLGVLDADSPDYNVDILKRKLKECAEALVELEKDQAKKIGNKRYQNWNWKGYLLWGTETLTGIRGYTITERVCKLLEDVTNATILPPEEKVESEAPALKLLQETHNEKIASKREKRDMQRWQLRAFARTAQTFEKSNKTAYLQTPASKLMTARKTRPPARIDSDKARVKLNRVMVDPKITEALIELRTIYNDIEDKLMKSFIKTTAFSYLVMYAEYLKGENGRQVPNLGMAMNQVLKQYEKNFSSLEVKEFPVPNSDNNVVQSLSSLATQEFTHQQEITAFYKDTIVRIAELYFGHEARLVEYLEDQLGISWNRVHCEVHVVE